MSESILISIKKMLGIAADYTAFDTDIIIHINSVFTILNQLGVCDSKHFSITDETEVWEDFLEDSENLNLVKSYIYLKVKLIFDPPQSGVLHEAMERQIKEFEWRLNALVDNKIHEDAYNSEIDNVYSKRISLKDE